MFHAIKNWLIVIGLSVAVHDGLAQPKNIKLPDPLAGASSKATVIINRKDRNNWLVNLGGRLFFTKDAGHVWTQPKFKPTLYNYGDQSVASNGRGALLAISTAGPGRNATDSIRDRIAIRSTSDGGSGWDDEYFYNHRPAHGQARPRAGMDKGTIYLTWTEFDRDTPKDSVCSANIFFGMTSTEGKKWSDPVRINTLPGECSLSGESIQSAAPVNSSDGKLFVLWANQGKLFLDRSYNSGKTWLNNDLAINNTRKLTVSTIPGVASATLIPTLAIDKSMSYFRSTLYLAFSDQSNGENDSDIWLMRSTNRGDFWTAAQRINQDTSRRHQFLPSMVVDEDTGVIYLAWYDCRNHTDGQTDVYLAYSVDGGSNFVEKKISESPFLLTTQTPLTDPVSLDVFDGMIVPVWSRIDNGVLTFWTAPMKQADLIKKDELPRIQSVKRPQPTQ